MSAIDEIKTAFEGEFMTPEIHQVTWQEFLRDYCGDDDVANYSEESEDNPNGVIWIGRLSANGYLDATEWTVSDSEDDVAQILLDTYAIDESDKEKVEQWLSENQPNMNVTDVYSVALASLILKAVGLNLGINEAQKIFPNLGCYDKLGARIKYD